MTKDLSRHARQLRTQDPNDEPAAALLMRIRAERQAADSPRGVGPKTVNKAKA